MKTANNDELFPHVSTTKLGLGLASVLEISVLIFLRKWFGFRFLTPQKAFFGFIAGFVCILLTHGLSEPGSMAPRTKYDHGWLELYTVGALAVMAIQFGVQKKRLRLGIETHSYSSGMPLLCETFPRTRMATIHFLEILLLVCLGILAEGVNIPFGPWLWFSAAALFIRGRMDAFAQQLADADVIDAAIQAEEMARTLRARRGSRFD